MFVHQVISGWAYIGNHRAGKSISIDREAFQHALGKVHSFIVKHEPQ